MYLQVGRPTQPLDSASPTQVQLAQQTRPKTTTCAPNQILPIAHENGRAKFITARARARARARAANQLKKDPKLVPPTGGPQPSTAIIVPVPALHRGAARPVVFLSPKKRRSFFQKHPASTRKFAFPLRVPPRYKARTPATPRRPDPNTRQSKISSES
jgi:hypothetical protein